MLKSTPFDIASKILHLDGQPFDLSEREYLRPLYNSPVKRHVYKFSRQCEKSSSLAAKMCVYGSMIPAFKNLYVSPTMKQTQVFSSVRLKNYLDSPFIRKHLKDKNCDDAVFRKSLTNYSQFFLEYAFHTPDRVRGISTDAVYIDEVQDIVTDFIPVIEEAASHSKYKYFYYAGTPKTPDNTIEYFWDKSTQRELAVKCTHCNGWNVGLDEKNISEDGLICSKCTRGLDNRNCQWVWGVKLEDAIYEGFHLNQLNVPWTDFKDVIEKQKIYSSEKFHNEVLGLPYDSGQKPITMAELAACCNPNKNMATAADRFSSPLIAGIDWGITSDMSYTVLTIGEYNPFPGKFHIHFIKKYEEKESDLRHQVTDITRICKEFDVEIIGADWGVGALQNVDLAKVFGGNRIIPFYHTGNQQERIRYNKKRIIYTTNRTLVMGDLFLDFRRNEIEIFNWEVFKKYGQDILNINIEKRESQQRETLYYDHRVDKPDDVFHSILFCKLAGDIYYTGRAK